MSMYDIGAVRRKRVTQQSSMMFGQSIAASGFDAATLAWVAAVFAVDSTVVSAPQATLVDNLIVGLKADGLFTKLDRLWLFAIENQTEALVDIVADSLATAVSSPTFAPNTGFGSPTNTSSSLGTNFNPSSGSPKYSLNSASVFAWNNTAATPGSDQGILCSDPASRSRIQAHYLDNRTYHALNNSQSGQFVTAPGTGLFVITRTTSTDEALDLNGVQQDLNTDPAVAIPTGALTILVENGAGFGLYQVCCYGVGGGLSGTDRTNIYSRLRTYMTAVGVP